MTKISKKESEWKEIIQNLNTTQTSYDASVKALDKIKMNTKNTFSFPSTQNLQVGTIPGAGSGNGIVMNGDSNNGYVKIDVPLMVNGRNLMQEIDEMRDVLLLLKRDVDMEAKYPRLKELKEEYEAELAKYKTFDTLKESK